jgi:N-acetylglucosaminyldiphosphoundecaprenol N-acetyl-beta-D-mannosaminyltransferase
MLNAINKANPFAVFVGMTAPKQEKWVYQNCNSIHSNVICSIGAVFDFYAETIKRPSKIWVRSNLEWFIRLIREPKRLYKRYLIYSPKFLVYLLAYLFRFKGSHPEKSTQDHKSLKTKDSK